MSDDAKRGGTRPARPNYQGAVEADRSGQSGDRNDMTKSDPIKR